MELPVLLDNPKIYLSRFFGKPFELRVIQSGEKFNMVYSCIRDDWEKIFGAVKKFNENHNVYICLNPLKPECKSKSTFGEVFKKIKGGEGIVDEEIDEFRWLYIDIDPKRVSGIASTNIEKHNAWRLLQEIKDFMREKGFKDPVVCDSGNGYHLHYRISLPYSKDNQDLMRRVLLFLNEEFSTDMVDVDRKVFNAARITKLYGTVSRKGKNDVENGRPHRKSGFIEFPDNVENEINSEELLQTLAQKPKKSTKKDFNDKYKSSQSESIEWVRDFFDTHGINYWNEDDGKTYKFFFEDGCPFNPAHGRKDAYVMINEEGKRVFKCFHNSCEGNGWHEFVKLFDENHLTPDEREEKREENLIEVKKLIGEEVPFDEDDFLEEKHEKTLDKKAEKKDKKSKVVKIDRTEKGAPIQSITNFLRVLSEDDFCKDIISFNELANLAYNKKEKCAWRDSDDSALLMYIETKYNLNKRVAFFDALELALKRTRYNPVAQFLDSLVWDKEKRLDTMLSDYLGAENTAYTKAVARLMVLGAVARAYEPGCKFDYVPVLVGGQGLGKSTFCRRLACLDEFFSDGVRNLGDKDSIESIQGSWIIELGELSALSRAKDAEVIKLFTSQQSDKFRPAYGRNVQVLPRRCVFIGTTNNDSFLIDKTGNRRFLPINTGTGTKSLWGDTVADEFKQILAEAVSAFKNGERPLLPKNIIDVATQVQEDHLEVDVREGIIENWILAQKDLEFVCIKSIWDDALGLFDKELSRKDSREIGQILNRLPSLTKHQNVRFQRYGVQKAWAIAKKDLSELDL